MCSAGSGAQRGAPGLCRGTAPGSEGSWPWVQADPTQDDYSCCRKASAFRERGGTPGQHLPIPKKNPKKPPQNQGKVTPKAQLCVPLGKLCLQGTEPLKKAGMRGGGAAYQGCWWQRRSRACPRVGRSGHSPWG